MHIFKVARALLIFFSVGYLTYIATISLQTVLNGEIGVAVSAVTDNQEKRFPLYTFCPDWNQSIHSDGLYDGRVSIEDILADDTNVHDFISVEESAVNGTWLKSYRLETTTQGERIDGSLNPCFTHYMPDADKVEDLAKEIIFRINMTTFGDLHLAMHDDGGYIDTHFNVYGREQITFPTQMLGKAINRKVKIEIRNQEIEVADKSQCKEISELDPYCLETIIEHQLQCKIPWTYTINSPYELCQGSKNLKMMVDLWPDGTTSSRSGLIQTLDSMKCFKSCVYNNYQPVKIYDKEYSEEINELKNQAFLYLHIRLNNQGLERHAEFYIYDWGSFLSEIGGYLGLFLGYALVSIVDFVENVWNSICNPQEMGKNQVGDGNVSRIIIRRRSSVTSRKSGSRRASVYSGNTGQPSLVFPE